jgi:hypothetical protein
VNPVKTSSQTATSIVTVTFDESIPLPVLTARADSLESSIALYLRRVFGAAADLTVSVGAVGRVSSDGQLVATFSVSPLSSGIAGANALAVAA